MIKNMDITGNIKRDDAVDVIKALEKLLTICIDSNADEVGIEWTYTNGIKMKANVSFELSKDDDEEVDG